MIDVKFDNECLSGPIIKIEHGGEILTSFLARSIETRLLFEADTTLNAFSLISSFQNTRNYVHLSFSCREKVILLIKHRF